MASALMILTSSSRALSLIRDMLYSLPLTLVLAFRDGRALLELPPLTPARASPSPRGSGHCLCHAC